MKLGNVRDVMVKGIALAAEMPFCKAALNKMAIEYSKTVCSVIEFNGTILDFSNNC